jgi:hypothetical protein
LDVRCLQGVLARFFIAIVGALDQVNYVVAHDRLLNVVVNAEPDRVDS